MHDSRRILRPLQYNRAARREWVQHRSSAQDVGCIPVPSAINPIKESSKIQKTYHGAMASTTPYGSRHTIADVFGSAGLGI
jgi:hypothetical protein